jgi:putative transposase
MFAPRSGAHLSTLLPLDREKNADRRRRTLPSHDQNVPDADSAAPSVGIAPLLKQQMAEYAATGLPPAYLPKDHALTPTDREDSES